MEVGAGGSAVCVPSADVETEGGIEVLLSGSSFAWLETDTVTKSNETLPDDELSRQPDVLYVGAGVGADTTVLRPSSADWVQLPTDSIQKLVFAVEGAWFEQITSDSKNARSVVVGLRPPLPESVGESSWELATALVVQPDGTLVEVSACPPPEPVPGTDLGQLTDLATADRLRTILGSDAATPFLTEGEGLPSWEERSADERIVDPEFTPADVMATQDQTALEGTVSEELLGLGYALCSRTEVGWGYCYALAADQKEPIAMHVYHPKSEDSQVQFFLIEGADFDSPVLASVDVAVRELGSGVAVEASGSPDAPSISVVESAK